MSRGLPRVVAVAIVVVGALLAIDGCRGRNTDTTSVVDSAPSPKMEESIVADGDAHPSVSASTSNAPPPPNAACAVAFASYPEGAKGPAPGDDLSSVPVPLVVPDNASLTISVRRTGHDLRIRGPAVVRPCTHDEPDVVLLVTGEASAETSGPVKPGAELFVATPAFVAVFGRATLRLRAGHAQSSWDIEDGEVTITNLDTPKTFISKNRDALKRYEDGGILLTRCAVQAASVASAERMLLGFLQTGDGGMAPPLPSASIGILTAKQIKHARERVLDCAFAEAFALSCDRIAVESDAAAPGCGPLGYHGVREHIARAVASGPIPPGSPPLRDAGP